MTALLLNVVALASSNLLLPREADVAAFNASASSWRLAGRAPSEELMTLTAVLTVEPQARAALEATFWAVSNPKDAKYGKHLTAKQLKELLAVPEARTENVRSFFAGLRGATATPNVYGDAITLKVPVAEVERALHTSIGAFTHSERPEVRILRATTSYSLPLSIAAGAWGENVLLKGTDIEGRPLDAAAICIGDILEATRGSLRLEVTCPRRPCCKVDQQFGQTWRGAGVRAHTARNGMAGFFCRVLKPGRLAAGDELQVVQRRRPEWSLRRVSDVVYGRTSGRTSVADEASYSIRCLGTIENSEEMDLRLALLRELVQVKELADFEWRDKIREMLQLHESRRCLLQ